MAEVVKKEIKEKEHELTPEEIEAQNRKYRQIAARKKAQKKKKDIMVFTLFAAFVATALFFVFQMGGTGIFISAPKEEVTEKGPQYAPTNIVTPHRMKSPDEE